MPQGYTVPLSPRGIANRATKPPWHYAGVVAGAEFWTDPAAAAATLPDGFTPDPQSAGRGTVLFIDWRYSGSRDEYLGPVRSRYHEFFVLLDARWQGTRGLVPVYLRGQRLRAGPRVNTGFPEKTRHRGPDQDLHRGEPGRPRPRPGRQARRHGVGRRLPAGDALMTRQAPVGRSPRAGGAAMVNLRHFPRLGALAARASMVSHRARPHTRQQGRTPRLAVIYGATGSAMAPCNP